MTDTAIGPQGPRLSGRVALVTGGGRGIGAAIARALGAAGARVAVTGRQEPDLLAVAQDIAKHGGVAVACVADVTKKDDVDRLLVETKLKIGPVDILVNNAGLAESAPLRHTDDELWDRHMALNLTAPFRLCRAVAEGMTTRGFGRIVNVASTAGRSGVPYTTAYGASKAGLIGLTRALAAELGGRGVTVNAVCPGWVETDLSARALDNITAKTGLDADAARARLVGASPAKRFMTADEIAAVVTFLAGDAAGGVNGQAWNVDGGAIMS